MHNKTSPNFFGEAPNSLIWEGREVELASSQPFPAEGLRHGMTTEVPGGTIRGEQRVPGVGPGGPTWLPTGTDWNPKTGREKRPNPAGTDFFSAKNCR